MPERAASRAFVIASRAAFSRGERSEGGGGAVFVMGGSTGGAGLSPPPSIR